MTELDNFYISMQEIQTVSSNARRRSMEKNISHSVSWSREEAEVHCTQHILSSSIVDNCASIAPDDITKAFANCFEDNK